MDEVTFFTDAATLCVFDLSALRHRIEDDGDWWSMPDEELLEVNKGNAAFIGLREDGRYNVQIMETLDNEDFCMVLNCPSGHVFVGAGEEVTGDGLEPEAIRGGTFLAVKPGNYRLRVRRESERVIAVSLEPTDEARGNRFTGPVRV